MLNTLVKKIVLALILSTSAQCLHAASAYDEKAGWGASGALIRNINEGDFEGVLIAVNNHANVNAEVGDQYVFYGEYSALSFACIKGHFDIVRYLIDKGAKINPYPKSETPPLSAAAESGHSAIVRLLLHKGADVDALDPDERCALGDTLRALSNARRGDEKNLIKKLKQIIRILVAHKANPILVRDSVETEDDKTGKDILLKEELTYLSKLIEKYKEGSSES